MAGHLWSFFEIFSNLFLLTACFSEQTKEYKCDKCNHVFTRKLALNKHSCKGDDAKRIIKEKITNKQSEISKIKGRISNIVRKYENVITYNVSLNDQDDYLKNLKKQIYEMKEVPSRLKLKTLFKINKISPHNSDLKKLRGGINEDMDNLKKAIKDLIEIRDIYNDLENQKKEGIKQSKRKKREANEGDDKPKKEKKPKQTEEEKRKLEIQKEISILRGGMSRILRPLVQDDIITQEFKIDLIRNPKLIKNIKGVDEDTINKLNKKIEEILSLMSLT